MGQNKIPNRLLIIGNGFDLNLGRNTRYSDFILSPTTYMMLMRLFSLDIH